VVEKTLFFTPPVITVELDFVDGITRQKKQKASCFSKLYFNQVNFLYLEIMNIKNIYTKQE